MNTERLVQAMKAKGLNQAQLSEAIGASQQNVSAYCTGKHEPKASTLGKISQALGVSCAYLVGLTNDPLEDPEDALSPDELALLRNFRLCTPEWKKIVFAAALRAAEESRPEAEAVGKPPERGVA